MMSERLPRNDLLTFISGSGAGSRISELLRDEYPSSFMSHAAVWPSRRGEVVVQSYNAVLSLARLLESTDALLALHNDEAHDICEVRLRYMISRDRITQHGKMWVWWQRLHSLAPTSAAQAAPPLAHARLDHSDSQGPWHY